MMAVEKEQLKINVYPQHQIQMILNKCCWVSKKSTSCEPFPKDQDAFDVIESTYKDGGMKVECGANFLNTISLISFVVTFLF